MNSWICCRDCLAFSSGLSENMTLLRYRVSQSMIFCFKCRLSSYILMFATAQSSLYSELWVLMRASRSRDLLAFSRFSLFKSSCFFNRFCFNCSCWFSNCRFMSSSLHLSRSISTSSSLTVFFSLTQHVLAISLSHSACSRISLIFSFSFLVTNGSRVLLIMRNVLVDHLTINPKGE
uniref:Uncharacterized protein n=1 Tax=Cacopsylla melanoneura TaxID=428564 RepID=A0A8D9F388_9HEMI